MQQRNNDKPFDQRAEQMEHIKTKLDVYQRRYPMLDIAYQYKDWTLDVLARNPPIVEYEWAFMQWLERNQRRANEASGRIGLDEALERAPKLAAGFKRLVAAFRQDNYISPETIRVYAEEFAGLTEDEFSEMCTKAIRHLEKFPTVAALLRLRAEGKEDESLQKAESERRAEEEERRQAAIRTALIEQKIAALPEAERKALEQAALESLGISPDTPRAFREILVKKRMLGMYEEKHGEGGSK